MKKYNKLNLPELPDLKKEGKLNDLIGDLYEVDGYLAGAISTMKIDLIKKGVKFMGELLIKIKRVKTNAPEKKNAIKYIEESIRVGKGYL